jgi:hypothetical protein
MRCSVEDEPTSECAKLLPSCTKGISAIDGQVILASLERLSPECGSISKGIAELQCERTSSGKTGAASGDCGDGVGITVGEGRSGIWGGSVWLDRSDNGLANRLRPNRAGPRGGRAHGCLIASGGRLSTNGTQRARGYAGAGYPVPE